MTKAENTKRGANVAEELLVLGEELYSELIDLSIEAEDVKKLLTDARTALSDGNVATATVKATDACTLAEQRKSEGIIQIVGKKVADIKDFLGMKTPDTGLREVREYLARGEDALILGHYEEANRYLDNALLEIGEIRTQWDSKKVSEIIGKAEISLLEGDIPDPDGKLIMMLDESKKYLLEGDLQNAQEQALSVVHIFSEENKNNELEILRNELVSIDTDITQLEKLDAEVNALKRRYNDAVDALEEEDFDRTRAIITNCYQISGRLKDRVQIKAAQERLAKAKYVVDQVGEIELDTDPIKTLLEESKSLFRDKRYNESIEASDRIIADALGLRDDYYLKRVTGKMEELKETIAQLEDNGLVLDDHKHTLEIVAENIGKKKYFECENLLENVALELLKEKNDMRIKKASNDIATIQADIKKLQTLGLAAEHVEELMNRAQSAFNEYKYHEIGDLADEARELTTKKITKYRIDEGQKEYDELEKWMLDLSKQDVEVSGAWVMFNEGREYLSNGNYKEANRIQRRVREILDGIWEKDIKGKMEELKARTKDIKDELKESGLRALKAEKLLRMAELKVQAKAMDEGFKLVRQAYESAQETKHDFLRKKYLDLLLDYHSKLKALTRAGLDVSGITEELNRAKEKVETKDFKEMDELLEVILNSITQKKGEYLRGLSQKRIAELNDLIEEYGKADIDLKDIRKLAGEAQSSHESGDFDTSRELVEEAREKAGVRFKEVRTLVLKKEVEDLSEKTEIWRGASLDVTTLEVLLEDARNDLEIDDMEKAVVDMERARNVAEELESSYRQEEVLDTISEMKAAFRELMEMGIEITVFQKQMEAIKAHFAEMEYAEAYEMAIGLKDGVRTRKRYAALHSKKQALLARFVELENEGLDMRKEGERFSYVDTLLGKEEFDSAEVIMDKMDVEMEKKSRDFKRDYYNSELGEYDKLLAEFVRKGIETASLVSFRNNAETHMEKEEYEVAANFLKIGWKEAEAARDFYMSNKLLGQLYELEDAVFELANRGADFKSLDGELVTIKKMISGSAFEEARVKIEEVRNSIREIEIEFFRGQYREVLVEMERHRLELEEMGMDTSEMRELMDLVEERIAEAKFDEAEKAFENLRKKRDALELGSRVESSRQLLEDVDREIDRLREKGIDVDLMKDLYKDAQSLLDRNNFSEVEAYSRLALKEGRMREREHDMRVAKERLYRTRNVIEFISRDSEGTLDISELHPRLKELRERIESEVTAEVLQDISQLEDEVREMSHDYMQNKALATKKLLEDMIGQIDEMGGVSSPLYTYVQKGDKLLDKEHFGPSIEWYQKGIEKAAMEKKRREIKRSIESLQERIHEAKEIGVDVRTGQDLLEEGRKAFKKDELDDSWELLEKAKRKIEKARLNFQEAKVKNLLITSNVIFEELIKMEVPREKLETEKKILDDIRHLLKIGDLDNAEKNAKKVKELLIKSKSIYNIKRVKQELARTLDLCATMEEQGVEISSSMQILNETSVFLGDLTSLCDEDYRSIMDDISHAIKSAREQERMFKIHLLENNLERTEALMIKYDLEGVDTREPRALLEDVKRLQEEGRIEKGLEKVEECVGLLDEIRSGFFKESADGLLYTAELLMEDIRKLGTNVKHLESMFEEAKEGYSKREYRKSAHKLKSVISACDEITAIGKVQQKLNRLMEAVYNSPIESEPFEEDLKKVGDLLAKGEAENAEVLYAGLAQRFRERMNNHEYSEMRKTISQRELEVRELGSDGIVQVRALTLIEHSKKYLEEGELDNAREISENAVEIASRTRIDRMEKIHDAVLSLEDKLIEIAEMKGERKELLTELNRIVDETRSQETHDLTGSIIGLSAFLGTLEGGEIKAALRARITEIKGITSELVPYLSEENIDAISDKLDDVNIPGPSVPISEGGPFQNRLDEIWEVLLDKAEDALSGILVEIDDIVEKHGGEEGILSEDTPGISTYNIFLREIRATGEEEVVRRLRLATLMREEIEGMRHHIMREGLGSQMEDLREIVIKMETEDFSPSSAKHWLGESKNALEEGDFEESEKCLKRATEGAENARKRFEQEKASRKISEAIKDMKGRGLKFSEAKEVQLWLKKAQEAERSRNFHLVEDACRRALKAADEHLHDRKTKKIWDNVERIEKAIRSEKREIDTDSHLEKLSIAKSYLERGMLDLAKGISKSADRDMHDNYWLAMLHKVVSRYEDIGNLAKEAEEKGIDTSEVDALTEESRKLFLRDAQALAMEKAEEAFSMATELKLKNQIRVYQNEVNEWRAETDDLERKGGDVEEVREHLDELLEMLKKKDLEAAEEVKGEVRKSISEAKKNLFRADIRGTLDKCNEILGEVSSMKGDADLAKASIQKAMDYLSGELLESANEVSQNCLNGLMEQRNELLKERASTVLYAAGEIVRDTDNENAADYYLKAQKAFKLERYKEALSMARESMKLM